MWTIRSVRINFSGNPFSGALWIIYWFLKKNLSKALFTNVRRQKMPKGCFKRSLILCASCAHPPRLAFNISFRTILVVFFLAKTWIFMKNRCLFSVTLSHFIVAINKFLYKKSSFYFYSTAPLSSMWIRKSSSAINSIYVYLYGNNVVCIFHVFTTNIKPYILLLPLG